MPQAQPPWATGLSIVNPDCSSESTKSIVASDRYGTLILSIDEPHAELLGGLVLLGQLVVEVHRVPQARAPTRLDGDAQGDVVAALFDEELLHLACGGSVSVIIVSSGESRVIARP